MIFKQIFVIIVVIVGSVFKRKSSVKLKFFKAELESNYTYLFFMALNRQNYSDKHRVNTTNFPH